MEKGINAHRVGSELIENFYYVRFPFWTKTFDYHKFVDAMDRRGIWIEAVLDNRFYVETQLRWFKKEYPTITWLQVTNEADNPAGDGTGSGSLPPSITDRRLRTARDVYDDNAFITLGGMASANGAKYIRKLKNLGVCNAISAHLYGIQPYADWPHAGWGFTTVEYALRPMKQICSEYGLQLEVSEFGAPAGMFDNEVQRAEYYRLMLHSLRSEGVARCAPYCLTQGQEITLGLLGPADEPTERYRAVNEWPIS